MKVSGGMLILASLFSVSYGRGKLWVKMIDFVNPGGKGNNGHPCDGKFFFSGSDCDHRFTLCVDNAHGPNNVVHCSYGRQGTGQIVDRNSMRFGSNVAGMRNPLTFSFNSWPGAVKIKVEIWDTDHNDDDYVDFLSIVYTATPHFNSTSGQSYVYTLRRRTRLRLQLKVYCDLNYYGSDCASYCYPIDNVFGHYTCNKKTGAKVCLEGWKGDYCNVRKDLCASSPCRNNATCHSGISSFRCICADGYSGNVCQTNIDECQSSPCLHNSTCVDMVNGYQCTCVKGFTGITCSVNVDDCQSSPCLNRGTCTDLVDGFRCDCPSGFTGNTCSINIDDCAVNSCLNNATCVDQIDGFHCWCTKGWHGRLCDQENPCFYNPCRNGGTCIEEGDSYACNCPVNWKGSDCDIFDHTAVCNNFIVKVKGILNKSLKERFVYNVRYLISEHLGSPMYQIIAHANFTNRMDEKGQAGTLIELACFENGKKVCPGVLTNALSSLKNYSGTKVANSGLLSGQTVETRNNTKWIETNWYIVVILGVCVLLLSVVVFVFIKRKRHKKAAITTAYNNQTDTCHLDEAAGFIPISFENSLYATTQPEETIRVSTRYDFNDMD